MASVLLSCLLGLALVAAVAGLCAILEKLIILSLLTPPELRPVSASIPSELSEISKSETVAESRKIPESRSNMTPSGDLQSSPCIGSQLAKMSGKRSSKSLVGASSATAQGSKCMSEAQLETWRLWLMSERMSSLDYDHLGPFSSLGSSLSPW